MANPYTSPSARQSPASYGARKLSLWQVLFSINGRINRLTYWMYKIFSVILISVLAGYFYPYILEAYEASLTETLPAEQFINPNIEIEPIASTNIVIVCIVTLAVLYGWSSFCISVKRWHDRDKSGWWIFIVFVPLIGPLWSLIENGF